MADEGFLQIRNETGVVATVPLAGDRMIIGRSANVDIVLEGQTVSRRHAELFKDPYGRWWVRDLGSRNGTLVNGTEAKEETVVQVGDLIQVEEFGLRFRKSVTQSGQRQPTSVAGMSIADAGVTLADVGVGPVKSLRDLEPPQVDANHLFTLTEFAGQLLATEDDDQRMKDLCELMVDQPFHGTSAMALRLGKDQKDREPVVLCEPVSAAAQNEPPYISSTVLRAVLAKEAPVVASNTQGPGGGQDMVEMSLVAAVKEIAAVACPIASTSEYLDVLYVTLPAQYGTAKWMALASLASEQFGQAQAAWEARRAAQEQAVIEQELRRAHNIQMRLVPKDFNYEALDIGFGFEPCKWVGGDYVDALKMKDGRLFVTVMDVCGKGLQAALITTGLHTTVHLLIDQGLGLVDLVTTLNNHLVKTLPDESFVTMCSMAIDPVNGEIECVNCGHPPAFIVNRAGVAQDMQSGEHAPLGYIEMDITAEKYQLEKGQIVSSYSDGLSEMVNEADDMLGVDGVRTYISDVYKSPATDSATQMGTSATQVATLLKDKLANYKGKALPNDDTSYFVVLRK